MEIFCAHFQTVGKRLSHLHAKRHFDGSHNDAELKYQVCPDRFNGKDSLKRHAVLKHGLIEVVVKAMITQ